MIKPLPLLLSILALANLLGCASSLAFSYSVSGNFEIVVLGWPGGPSAYTNTGRFKVSVADCRWWIDLFSDPIPAISGPPVYHKSEVASFDGTTVYEYSVPMLPPGYVLKPGQVFKNYGFGEMVNGPVPQRINDRMQFLWLGLASGCVWPQTNSPFKFRSLLLPPEDTEVHDNSRLQDIYLKVSSQEPRLPEYIASVWLPDQAGDPRYTNLVYKVNAWTNYSGLAFPRDSEIQTLFLTNVMMRFSSHVTAVDEKSRRESFVPAFNQPSAINDRRQTNSKPFLTVVHLKTNEWPSLRESREAYAREAGFHKSKSKEKPSLAMRVALAVAILSPALIWLRFRRNLKS